MRFPALILCLLLLALALTIGVWRLAVGTESIPPRDVIVILLDAVRLDALGCYGHPGDPTPNLDGFARDGARFTRSYASSGWTLPSAGSLLTGTWPTIHGGLNVDSRMTKLREDVPTGPEIMRRRGFWTAGLGNTAFLSPLVGLDRGFDYFDARYTDNQGGRRADETVDDFLRLLDRAPDDSRFFFLHFFDPHLNYDPPGPFGEPFQDPPPPLDIDACQYLLERRGEAGRRYVRDAYQAEVRFLDEQLGRLFQELKRAGRYEDALIIITADHGEEFLDHGEFEHGHHLYEELVHVPLLVKLPRGTGPAGCVVETRVRSVDIMPTIFELTHLKSPPSFAGRSLVPLLEGASEPDRPVFLENTLYGPPRIALISGNHKLIQTENPKGSAGIEVFDLGSDPGERKNLAPAEEGLVDSLRRQIGEHFQSMHRRIEGFPALKGVQLNHRAVNHLKSLGYLR